jgi:hypothetical protein
MAAATFLFCLFREFDNVIGALWKIVFRDIPEDAKRVVKLPEQVGIVVIIIAHDINEAREQRKENVVHDLHPLADMQLDAQVVA